MQLSNGSTFPRRALAYLLDLLVIYLLNVGTILLFVTAFSYWQYGADRTLTAALVESPGTKIFTKFAHILLYLSYFALAHWYFSSTFGKWILGIQIKQRNLSISRALGRSFAYFLSGHLTLGLGFILPLFRKDGRALHDILCQTDVIIHKSPGEAASRQAA